MRKIPAATQKWPIEDRGVQRHLAQAEVLPAEAALDAAEFASFFECSLDLLCVAGLDGCFKRLNPAWTAVFGWTLQELKAKPFFDLIHPEDRAATRVELAKLAAGTAAIQFENRYCHRDGSYRWLQWNARQMPGRELIYATARDISRQKWLERENLEIADREKDRLARELHDGLCQNLAGIAALSLTLSRTLAARSESALSDAAAEITQLLNEAIGEAHDMAHGLDPVGLKEVGLDGALESLALTVEHRLGVTCEFACDLPFHAVAYESGTHLFRIAQEAVSNAVTHGKATRIEIGLRWKNGQGLMSVSDDGVGISAKARNPGGSGLHTMGYRARTIGGFLTVRRRSERGTVVTCSFPLAPTPDGSPDRVRDNS